MTQEGFEQIDIQTRAPEERDLQTLLRIIEHWVKDRETGEPLPDEVASILAAVGASIKGEGDTKYVVAEANGKLAGMMGFKNPADVMKQYAETENPTEIVNAFVDPALRAGRGVGSALIGAAEAEAAKLGHTEMVLNSGPRYKDTAWGFYTKMYGEPVAVMRDYYGPGGDAPVWRRALTPKLAPTGPVEGPRSSFS